MDGSSVRTTQGIVACLYVNGVVSQTGNHPLREKGKPYNLSGGRKPLCSDLR